MNILHLSFGALPAPFGASGGALQRRVTEVTREQARRGHRVRVLVAERRGARREIDGADVHFMRSVLPSPWLHLEHQARSIVSIARGDPVDVVHVHNEPEAALMGRWLRLPMLLQYDNYFFRGHGRLFPLYRRAFRAFEVLLPCSDYCRIESTAYWDLPLDSCVVMPNGVSTEQFTPRPAEAAKERQRLGIGAGPVLLYVGRICKQKGSDVLLDAFTQLKQSRPEVELLVAGPIGQFHTASADPSADAWQRALAAAGARYLGLVEEERLAPLMTLADVFVMPTSELEMQGMAALEAQACGTPVIASDHGGLKETVPDGCGLRFPPRDGAALAEAIEALLRDPGRRADLAAGALRHARSFSWPRICDRLEEAYELARSRR